VELFFVGKAARRELRNPRRLGLVEQRGGVGTRLVETAPGEKLPEHDADREDIGAPVERIAARLLGAHVAGLALDHVLRIGPRFHGVVGVGDAEVAQLDLPLEADEKVRRRDVAVHDAERRTVVCRLAVRVVERAKGFDDHEQRILHGQRRLGARTAAQEVVEVEALDVLHRDVEKPVGPPEVVHLDDVGMIEPGGELRLRDQEVGELAAVGEMRQDLLDDRQPRHADVGLRAGQEDVGHTAATDLVEQRVAPDVSRELRFDGGGGGCHGMVGPNVFDFNVAPRPSMLLVRRHGRRWNQAGWQRSNDAPHDAARNRG
jgi:hypothetical protein